MTGFSGRQSSQVDDGHGLPELHRGDGGLPPRGSAADDDEVVGFGIGATALYRKLGGPAPVDEPET
jgi:hypothetical protein